MWFHDVISNVEYLLQTFQPEITTEGNVTFCYCRPAYACDWRRHAYVHAVAWRGDFFFLFLNAIARQHCLRHALSSRIHPRIPNSRIRESSRCLVVFLLRCGAIVSWHVRTDDIAYVYYLRWARDRRSNSPRGPVEIDSELYKPGVHLPTRDLNKSITIEQCLLVFLDNSLLDRDERLTYLWREKKCTMTAIAFQNQRINVGGTLGFIPRPPNDSVNQHIMLHSEYEDTSKSHALFIETAMKS